MALLRLGLGSQGSGSIGGSVLSRNRFGAYVRARSVPVNPNTDRQSDIRAILANLSIAWAVTLTQAQRDAWEAYAANVSWLNALGDAVNLTGLNHYVRSNTPRIQAGLARVDVAPVIFELAPQPDLGAMIADASADTLSVGFTNTEQWATEVGGALYVSMGLPQNLSRKFFNGPWRFQGAVLGAAMAPTSPNVFATAAWPIGTSQRVWVEARAGLADGRLSERVRVNFPSVA